MCVSEEIVCFRLPKITLFRHLYILRFEYILAVLCNCLHMQLFRCHNKEMFLLLLAVLGLAAALIEGVLLEVLLEQVQLLQILLFFFFVEKKVSSMFVLFGCYVLPSKKVRL